MHASILRRAVPLALSLLLASPVAAATVGTAFTYQGDLEQSGSPVTGSYDFTFALYNAASGGTQVGTTQTALALAVTNGLFSATVDFGNVFDGTALYMQVGVRPASTGSYTAMTSRQSITPAPYALRAIYNPAGSTQWVSDGPDLTYAQGGVGFLGASSPFAAGKGVFIEGGQAFGDVFAFNYDNFTSIPLALNPTTSAGVGVGTSTPAAELDVVNRSSSGIGVQSTVTGSYVHSQNIAILGNGNTGTGISGTSAVGVEGISTDDVGVSGTSTNYYGISGTSTGSYGVYGTSTNNIGVYGYSANLDGTWGYSAGANKSGVVGISSAASGKGGYFRNDGGGVALYSDGLAKIKSLQILGGADLAERFECDGTPEPGTVMAIDPSSPGRVRVASEPYAHTVAGVVSGANGLSAGVELAKDDHREGSIALALTGRVWVKCDASAGAIHAGDLLTSAARPGYAMRAADAARAIGAIVGKAMTSLETGSGLVLVLVSLQ
jgi:hypothetical protein